MIIGPHAVVCLNMLKIHVILVLVLGILCNLCNTYKILIVFPIPGRSHGILGEAFVKTLLNAGHEVTYITSYPIKNTSQNLQQIEVLENFHVFPEDFLNIEKLLTKEVDLYELSVLLNAMNAIANSTLMNDDVQKMLNNPKEHFDVVIAEWMYTEVYSGFASVFNCPLIWSSSCDPHYLVLSLIDEDVNPTYTSDVFTTVMPPYTFVQRVFKLWSYLTTRYKKWYARDVENSIYESAFSSAVARRGRELPPYEEAMYNASLMFGNSHVSAGQSLRLPQNYIPILGYHIESEAPPLPEHLQKIMDNTEHGVIYMSMGSNLKSKDMPAEIKTGLLKIFSELKQTVIWKFEEQLQGVPSNVYIVEWAPQRSILAHPKCVLFITHGGLLSTTETLHHGVPIIGMPFFADQYNNINMAVAKGFAKRVDFNYQMFDVLKSSIDDIIGNSQYRKKAKELSYVYHHRRAPPREELVHWVDHVVRTGGAPHLRSPALHVPLYQKMYLDLLAILIATLVVIITLLKHLVFSKTKPQRKAKRH